MSKALKGALWSALVFPGLGQVVLRRYARGLAVMLVFAASVFVLIAREVRVASDVLAEIRAEGGMIDIAAISDAANQASSGAGSLLFSLLLVWILVCWILATVDAYRVGRRMDIEERPAGQGASQP